MTAEEYEEIEDIPVAEPMPIDPADVSRNGSAADFANTMLDKSAFINTLPQQYHPMMRMIERNVALSNTIDRDIPKIRAAIDEMQSLFLCTTSPRYYTPQTMYNLHMIRTIGELDVRRSLHANERGWIAEQFKFTSTTHNITREDETPGSFWSRMLGIKSRR